MYVISNQGNENNYLTVLPLGRLGGPKEPPPVVLLSR
jgi:hypothetical protein